MTGSWRGPRNEATHTTHRHKLTLFLGSPHKGQKAGKGLGTRSGVSSAARFTGIASVSCPDTGGSEHEISIECTESPLPSDSPLTTLPSAPELLSSLPPSR